MTMTEWLEQRLEAIELCMNASFAEEALVLLYSAIDTLAFLDAPAEYKQSDRGLFIAWCDKYIVPLFREGDLPKGIDLYGARCGLLHISSAASDLGREGK